MSFKTALVGAGLVTVALFFLPIDFGGSLWRAIFDGMHFPALALVTVAIFFALRPSRWPRNAQLARAGALSSAFALGVEIVQPFVGRVASVVDLKNGLLGIAIALAGIELVARRPRAIVQVVYGVAVLAATAFVFRPAYGEWRAGVEQRAQFPLLSSFENDFDFDLWQIHGDGVKRGTIAVSDEQASQGARSLRIDTPGGSWNGVGHSLAHPSWRAARTLSLDVYSPPALERILIHLADDDEHRFERWLELEAGWNHLEIAVSEIAAGSYGAPLDLGAMRYLSISTPKEDPGHRYYIDDVRLILKDQ